MVIQYKMCFLPAGCIEPFLLLCGHVETADHVEFLHVCLNLVDDCILVGLVGQFVCGVVSVTKGRCDHFLTKSVSEYYVNFFPDSIGDVGDVQCKGGGRLQFGHSILEELVRSLVFWVFTNLFLSCLGVLHSALLKHRQRHSSRGIVMKHRSCVGSRLSRIVQWELKSEQTHASMHR